jgi:hypothetical protein
MHYVLSNSAITEKSNIINSFTMTDGNNSIPLSLTSSSTSLYYYVADAVGNETKITEILIPSYSVKISGQVTSMDPAVGTTVKLLQGGTVIYSTLIAATGGNGQITQDFSISGITAGTYDLVVEKTGHLKYTITSVVIGEADIDLKSNSNSYISQIKLLAGDVNNNGVIDGTDTGIITSDLNYNKNTASASNPSADIDGNGVIDGTDVGYVTSDLNYNKGISNCTFLYNTGV